MNEERLLILKMVEEGRITAQEAVELLEVMEGGTRAKEVKTDDVWRKIEKQGEEFAQKVEKAAERFSRSIETKLDSGLTEQLANLPQLLAKIPFLRNITEESHKFVQEYSGTFAADLSEIPIELRTTNGAIRVEGWENDHYKLVVTQMIRAKERELALDKVIELDVPDRAESIDKLIVNVQEQKDVSISYHLSLPRKNPYLLKLTSTNGKCSVNNLMASVINTNTINGSINIKQSKAAGINAATKNGSNVFDYVESEEIEQTTANGSIKFMGSAKQIKCSSINGSVRVMPLTFAFDQGEMHLTTTNGGVRCILPRFPELNVKLDAVSSIGRIHVDLANFVQSIDEKSGGHHIVRGEVVSEESNAKSIAINARVNSGSIFIGQEKDEDASAK